MAGWADNIFGNLPGPPLPGSPRRPKLPDNTPLMPVDPRAVVGGLIDQGAQGVGHAIDYATGQPVGEGFSQPTLGREAYQMLTSPTFGGGMGPMAGASTLAVAPLAARAVRGARTAEEIATGARTAGTEADASAQAARAAQASPGQAALDRMTSGQAAPGAAETAAKGGITAYHGSPYSFDRFDISKIGTGEGAQAYGHGLYFAGNEDVAKSYRDVLSPGKWSYADKPASETWDASALDYLDKKVANDKGVPAAIDEAIGRLKNSSDFYNQTYASGGGGSNLYDNAIARLQRLDPSQVKPAGSVYQVNINADPEQFLDWDKPLSEQSPHVQQNLADVLRYHKVPLNNNAGGETTGGQMMGYLQSRFGNDVDPASELSDNNIPGIKYLDQGSRGAGGGGTRNYVTFSDDMIDILKKYGLAGALAPVGAGAAALQVMGQPGSGTTINSPPSNQQFY